MGWRQGVATWRVGQSSAWIMATTLVTPLGGDACNPLFRQRSTFAKAPLCGEKLAHHG